MRERGRKDATMLDSDLISALENYRIERGMTLSRLAMELRLTYPTVVKIFSNGNLIVARNTKQIIERYAEKNGINVALYEEIL